jgi:hypothetical protein
VADNTAQNGTGIIGADEIASVLYQRIKLIHGADGVNAGDVSTQNGLPIEEHFEQGRIVRNFILDTWTAAPVADAMQSVAQWYNNAAVGATVSPAVVPAGKVLRLVGARIETKSLATVGSVIARIRCNVAGTAVIGSPLVGSFGCGSRAGATTVAMTGGLDHQEIFWPHGIEIPAAAGVGFSLAGYGPTGTLALQGVTRFEVWGHEYSI